MQVQPAPLRFSGADSSAHVDRNTSLPIVHVPREDEFASGTDILNRPLFILNHKPYIGLDIIQQTYLTIKNGTGLKGLAMRLAGAQPVDVFPEVDDFCKRERSEDRKKIEAAFVKLADEGLLKQVAENPVTYKLTPLANTARQVNRHRLGQRSSEQAADAENYKLREELRRKKRYLDANYIIGGQNYTGLYILEKARSVLADLEFDHKSHLVVAVAAKLRDERAKEQGLEYLDSDTRDAIFDGVSEAFKALYEGGYTENVNFKPTISQEGYDILRKYGPKVSHNGDA